MAAGELVFEGRTPIIGGGRVLPSPSNFYLTGEDRLRVVSANSQTGVAVKVQWRTATLDGTTTANSQDHTPNTDRTTKTSDYELGRGALLNVTVFANAGAPRIGQTYVMVQLVRGFGAAAIVLGTLLAGYVTVTQALGFPGSPIESSIAGGGVLRAVLGTAPAPGVELNEIVPTGARWELLQAYLILNTSAAAGNRLPRVALTNPGVVVLEIVPAAVIGPSLAAALAYSQGVHAASFPTVPGAVLLQQPLPQPALLLATGTIQTGTVNFNGADAWSAPMFLIREWLEVA